ncbi:tyrosine-type recombinase/integrase [Marispirochaeta sp.]|uniref:tyrosine-type recombinase/integrase n=1 Tax=Marispirochaeta sp. TaxID=2038653 RepID=UPI0029C70DE5|nr:tyrosine-type recombinase/integrase [Marispirochaeta sp.]
MDIGIIPSHPGSRVKRVSERAQKLAAREKRAEAILELSEAKRLFRRELWKSNYSDDYIAYAAALFCFSVGARIGEARALKFDAINLKTGFCDIIRSYSDDEDEDERLKLPKWEHIRKSVPLSDMAIEAIQYVIDHYPYPDIQPDDYVFPNVKSRENPVTSAGYNQEMLCLPGRGLGAC